MTDYFFLCFISLLAIAIDGKSGIYWCDVDENKNVSDQKDNRFRNKAVTVHFDCDEMSLLVSSSDSYAVFENKLSETMMHKSLFLEKSKMKLIWKRYLKANNDVVIPYGKKQAYLALIWAHQKLKPNQHGLWLEFGVFEGFSVNVTSFYKSMSREPVYGFDSFKGLPTVWKTDLDSFPQGFFSLNGTLPPVRRNVKLIPGWFNETLPLFLSQHTTQKVSYVNIDNDLYDGTVDILTQLLPKFEHQTLLHFHELFQYNASSRNISGNSEMKALYDVLKINPDFKLQLIPLQGMFKEPAVFRVLQN